MTSEPTGITDVLRTIEVLRADLHRLVEDPADLGKAEVLQLSRRLDVFIAYLHRLQDHASVSEPLAGIRSAFD